MIPGAELRAAERVPNYGPSSPIRGKKKQAQRFLM